MMIVTLMFAIYDVFFL